MWTIGVVPIFFATLTEDGKVVKLNHTSWTTFSMHNTWYNIRTTSHWPTCATSALRQHYAMNWTLPAVTEFESVSSSSVQLKWLVWAATIQREGLIQTSLPLGTANSIKSRFLSAMDGAHHSQLSKAVPGNGLHVNLGEAAQISCTQINALLVLVLMNLLFQIPNHVIWLIMFYTLFHSMLNLAAEILRFGDRQFYQDWWNAESVHTFWKKWNIPVHNWCVRHVYVPLLKKGFSKIAGMIVVFLISALFHEYLVSVPLNMFGGMAFMGMLMQVPFALVVSLLPWPNIANICVWISLIIGQPLCMLMCYHDYYVLHMQTKA